MANRFRLEQIQEFYITPTVTQHGQVPQWNNTTKRIDWISISDIVTPGANENVMVSNGTIWTSGSVPGRHLPVTLATDHGLLLNTQTLALGTPSSITSTSTNSVTTTTHTHAITLSLALIGNGSAVNQIPLTGTTPFTPIWTTITSLVSLNNLSFVSTAFVKMTAANTFGLDTNVYVIKSGDTGLGNMAFLNNAVIDNVGGIGTDVLNIGTAYADTINIGWSGSTVNIQGVLTYQNVDNLEVKDKLIQLNKGGGVESGVSSGFEVEENSVITGWFTTSGARTGFELRAPATSYSAIFLLSGLSAERTYTWPNASGTVALTSDVPTTITVANEATDTTCFPLFVTDAEGNLAPKTNTGYTFNSATGILTVPALTLTTKIASVQLPVNLAVGAGLSVRDVADQSIIQFGNNLYSGYTGTVDTAKAGVMIRLDTRNGTGALTYSGQAYTLLSIQTRQAGVADGGHTIPIEIQAAPTGSLIMNTLGNIGLGILPTARLTLKAGTATVSTAPLKFTSGTHLTTTEAGAIEYNGTHLYFTAIAGGTRYQLDQQLSTTTLLNDEWIKAYDYAGNTANLIKLSKDNLIEFGAPVGIDAFYHVLNSGFNDVVDIPVSAANASGTKNGVGISIGGTRLFEIAAEKDATTGILGGYMIIPKMTTTQRDAITVPVEGMIIFNLTLHILNFYNGSVWTNDLVESSDEIEFALINSFL